MKNKVYTQVYSLLRTSRDGLVEALRTISQIGWDGIEAMGSNTGGLSKQAFKALLNELNLDIISFHALRDDEDLAFGQEFGARYTDIRMPHGTVTRDAILRAAEAMNQQAEKIAVYGMKAVFHNHANEFFFVEGEESGVRVYDLLLEHTDPALIGFELDVGWAARAGVDVVDYLRRHAGRFPLLHVKECAKVGANQDEMEHFPKSVLAMGENPEGQGKALIKGAPRFTEAQFKAIVESRSWNTALGQGILDWGAIRDAAEAQGVAAYINEREYYDIPGSDGTAAACSALDCAFLRAL
ncbi:sugar phosphate isomerase/epimerase [Oscillospiraceae bacterium OttesenSCG-928-F05]|nr:sugar phosphate isomerase/epimerase [Oscillospiraceae bacterium OttesenSCG-928-F05]